jgi:speckle-type POZ protein
MESYVFEALLDFVYTDSMPKIEVETEVEEGRAEVTWLQHLLVAADRYDLRRLKSMCEEQLSERIDVSSVATPSLPWLRSIIAAD